MLSKVDVINAVKNPGLIKDDFFRNSTINILPNDRVDHYSGGFSLVFPVINNENKWAIKIWHTNIPDNKQRYNIISKYLRTSGLPYFINVSYTEKGIYVKDQYCDICRMEWVEGLSLTEYISKNLMNSDLLEKLGEDFITMTKKLHTKNISHGDLQHENIIVKENGNLKLIDYDSICVPELSGKLDFSRGRLCYQHPSRMTDSEWLTSTKMDYFSELIIYISILAVSENYTLWDKYNVTQSDRLLFVYEDFLNFENSEIKVDLERLSERIRKLVIELQNYLAPHRNFIPFSNNRWDKFSNAFLNFINPKKFI